MGRHGMAHLSLVEAKRHETQTMPGFDSGRLLIGLLQETLNYWKQLPHVLKYFRPEEDPSSRLPKDFMSGFLEVCLARPFPISSLI